MTKVAESSEVCIPRCQGSNFRVQNGHPLRYSPPQIYQATSFYIPQPTSYPNPVDVQAAFFQTIVELQGVATSVLGSKATMGTLHQKIQTAKQVKMDFLKTEDKARINLILAKGELAMKLSSWGETIAKVGFVGLGLLCLKKIGESVYGFALNIASLGFFVFVLKNIMTNMDKKAESRVKEQEFELDQNMMQQFANELGGFHKNRHGEYSK